MAPALRCALWIALALALVTQPSAAATITNTFVGSSTGTATIGVSDTIQFEVTVTTNAGQQYDVILWTLTSDAAGCPACIPAGMNPPLVNEVVAWAWHYTPAGGSKVKMGTNGRISPGPVAIPPPDSLVGPYGFAGQLQVGDGIPALVGTVTIHADTVGITRGGGYQFPGVDGFCGYGSCELATVTGGEFTVVPEPGTASLFACALAGFAAARRARSGR